MALNILKNEKYLKILILKIVQASEIEEKKHNIFHNLKEIHLEWVMYFLFMKIFKSRNALN